MIAALSRAESWLVFMSSIIVGALVYVAVVGRARFNEMERQARAEPRTFTEPADSHVRIVAGPYDHEARGDFDG